MFDPPYPKFLFLLLCFNVAGQDQDTFSAFTASTRNPELKELEKLYQQLKGGKSHLFADPDALNIETKISICESIMKSGYFNMLSYKSKSIDMGKVYPELKRNTIIQIQEAKSRPRQHVYHKLMQRDDDLKSLLRYTYRTGSVSFTLSTGERVEEYAFACTRRILRRANHEGAKPPLSLYYISNAFEISDNPLHEQISIRVVCEVRHGECDFLGIAEQPATAFAYPEYSVEDVYRKMRGAYDVAQIAPQDPLCRLTKLEKLRVCIVVMNSSYFNGRVEVHPDVSDFQDACKQRIVSFRTETAISSSVKSFSEWMLTCSVKPLVRGAHSEYFVSRAYQSHYVAIYAREDADEGEQWYLENISGHVGVVRERNLNAARVKREGEFSPPDLKKLLEESKNQSKREISKI